MIEASHFVAAMIIGRPRRGWMTFARSSLASCRRARSALRSSTIAAHGSLPRPAAASTPRSLSSPTTATSPSSAAATHRERPFRVHSPPTGPRTAVPDAEQHCPACGAVAYDEVLPTDDSRGGQGGHGHDGPMTPCQIVLCRQCGHEEGAGSSLMRFSSPDDDEDPATTAARLARHRAEARVRKWYSDTMTLRGVTFPIYAAQNWPASIVGSGSSGDDLTELTLGHHTAENDDPFIAPDLRITTSIREAHDTDLHRARQALEMWVHDDHNRPQSDGLSDAATKLWFAARRRDRRAAAAGATQTERLIAIDGTPQPFRKLSTPTGRWVAVRRHGDLTITIAAHDIDPTSLALEPVSDPAARLLGPKPEEEQDQSA